ncbi:MAG: FtsQ-type POTRA domain-containing protein [Acidobacteria bacterium]|nr:FtsQ-type POTRA domain-containing protein [Acidobacteriota bacterium]
MPRKARLAERGEANQESAYLRRAKPVNVRRGPAVWVWTVARWGLPALIVVLIALGATRSVRGYVEASPSFVFTGDEQGLRVTGLRFVDENEVRARFDADSGQSTAAVPIDERRVALFEIPWVEEARVLRVWPNRVWVHIEERQPVAWVRVGAAGGRDFASLRLIDPHGVFLDAPQGFSLELPVISGIDEAMAIGERRVRVALVRSLLVELGPERAKVSEIDVADSANARVLTLYEGDIVELQMGAEEFRHRWNVFHQYVPSWKEKYGRIGSVDLRFEGQVAVSRVEF